MIVLIEPSSEKKRKKKKWLFSHLPFETKGSVCAQGKKRKCSKQQQRREREQKKCVFIGMTSISLFAREEKEREKRADAFFKLSTFFFLFISFCVLFLHTWRKRKTVLILALDTKIITFFFCIYPFWFRFFFFPFFPLGFGWQ